MALVGNLAYIWIGKCINKSSSHKMILEYTKKIFSFIACLLILAPQFTFGQDVISIDGIDCDIHGSAHQERPEYRLNEYKNRYNFPTKSDYVTSITLNELISSCMK